MVIVDANVFFDAADSGCPNCAWALEVLDANKGSLGIVPVVYTELLHASSQSDADEALASFGVVRLDMPWSACAVAARAFALYLRRSTKTRESKPAIPLPDFFIGAHAAVTGFSVATSDRGRFQSYFPKVHLIS